MKNKILVCHYCGNETKLVKGNIIYPKYPKLYDDNFYLCEPCEAYVGCHKGTTNPLGIVAKKDLRLLKLKCHYWFDKLYKEKFMKRKQAYKLLANHLGKESKDTHIGMFLHDDVVKTTEFALYLLRNRSIIKSLLKGD